MSLAKKVVRGAAWTISASIGSRALGLIGTLLLTRFIAPDEYGEVTIAVVLVLTTQQLSTLGFGQYVIAKPDSGRPAAFHATTLHLAVGAAALAVLLFVDRPLGACLGAPHAARFVPGLVASAFLDRIAFVPERVLVRDLRFSAVTVGRSGGELAYSVASVLLAAIGWGGMAIVAANVVRSSLRTFILVGMTDRREWLTPSRIRLEECRRLLRFGLPLSFGALAAFASRRWDNLLVARFFGPAPAGAYNLAYNLADVPAIQVGEQIGDVLFPSFARMDAERRKSALVRSLTLLGLLVFPLAVGLGAIAPTLVSVLFDPRWQPVAPMLMMLSVLSVTRPVGWTISAYLQAQDRPRWVMALESFKLVALLAAVYTLGRLSPLWTCLAVGLGFAAHTIASISVVCRLDGVRFTQLLGSVATPLVACIPLALGVAGAHYWYASLRGDSGVLELIFEIGAGAIAYVVGALTIAPAASRDLLERMRELLPSRLRPRNA